MTKQKTVEVTLLGLPFGQTQGSVRDSETGVVYELGVTHEVDVSTVARLKAVEQYGFTFWVGDPAALEVVDPPNTDDGRSAAEEDAE